MDAQKTDSLAQRPHRLRLTRQALFGLALLVTPALAVLTAFGIAPGAAPHDEVQRLVREPLDLPPLDESAPEEHRFVAQERVLRGDTVAALFDRLGVHDPAAIDFMKADATGRAIFRQLIPGRMLQAETGEEGQLLSLRYFMNANALLEVTRTVDGFSARQRSVTEAPRVFYRSATIQSSLFAASDAAGIPDAIAMQIARVFATDIDFHTDLRKGDRFSVAYEMIYDSGEFVGHGRILAAEFVNDGRAYHAVLFRDDEGNEGYFSLDGSNRNKAFMRSPLEYSRVSSSFGRRFHPIFRNWRAHTGVDFAAAHGTRVLATADGHVLFSGVKGGYGNTVEIRHGGGVTTLYAHLSRTAVRTGSRVRQGDPIGYVGATGYATGPHLHYEFKIAGAHQDPMRVALPKAEPVPAHLRGEFQKVAAQARAIMQRVGTSVAARFE